MLTACAPPFSQIVIAEHKEALSTSVRHLNALSYSTSTVIVQNVIHSHFTEEKTDVQRGLVANQFHSLPSISALARSQLLPTQVL